MADNAPVGLNRSERVLAFMIASSAGLSLLAIIAIILARVAGVRDFVGSIWLTVAVIPVIGLLLATVLIIALVVLKVVRRRLVGKSDR